MQNLDLDKEFYKIKDVAELLNVAPSTLRYWETEFPQCRPKRSAHNLRYYTPKDIETLRIIKYLVKDKGLKISAAKEQLRVNRDNSDRRVEIIKRLEHIRGELVSMKRALDIRKLGD